MPSTFMDTARGLLVASLAFCLALVAGSLPTDYTTLDRASNASASAAKTARPISANKDFSPVFRLGTAAQPFGWSTAVGDFNTDGTPDLVIADHTSRRAGVYAYRIQFSVSGLDARNFAFESAQAAVTLRISDIDHDNDLDVVVNSAASREVVGIWLNDGHGRFKSADIRRFAPEIQRLKSVGTTDPSVDPFTCLLSARRATDGLLLRAHTRPAVSRRPLVADGKRRQSLFRSPTATPRGPPLHLA